MHKVPQSEIDHRTRKLQTRLSKKDLDGAFILQNVDIYYLTGTIQSSILYVPVEGLPVLFVLKNLERVKQESALENLISINQRSQVFSALQDFGVRDFNRPIF